MAGKIFSSGLCAGACLLLASSLSAQINTERLRIGPEEPGFSNSFSLNFAVKDGNSDTLDVGAGMRLSYAKFREAPPSTDSEEPKALIPQYVVFLISNYSLSEQDGERGTNRSFSHLRWVKRHRPRIAWEAFAQHQFDEFQRLDTRWLLGGGSRLTLREEEHHEMFLGLGYMFEFERLDLPEASPEDRESRRHRLTTYFSTRFETSEKVSFVNTLYVQPRLDQWDDIRLLEEAELEVRLGERVSLGMALSIQHDSEPPQGVKDTDLALTNKLRFRF